MKPNIGVISNCKHLLEKGPAETFALGIHYVQLSCWNMSLYTDENVEKLKKFEKEGLHIASIWAGWEGPTAWNFTEGPQTLGLVPAAYRYERCAQLKLAIDFAQKLQVKDVYTHMGFVPENPSTTEYGEVVAVTRHLANYAKGKGVNFGFETGQETPITLLRLIRDVGTDNLRINLDPANLLLYGKANPIDALDIYGEYVNSIHVKDGEYPTDPRFLGVEKAIGEGRVHFELFLPKLLALGTCEALIIEREISGEQQITDIKKAKAFIEQYI